jgi:uncharacterized membrane protein YbhN (UPF0104 family)
MPNVTSVITRAIRKRLDWNIIGIAISVLIVTIAAIILVRLLRDIDVDKVVATLQATSIRQIALAGVFVAVAYLALTFYDFFALRTIGRDAVPYRIAALASFTAYTIGHNLGATVFTAGVIRLRIYSAWDLNIIDIAKIAFVTGLTFWLGNAFVLGAGMAYAPAAASAVNQLPPWVNRTIGVAGLMTIVGYLLWLRPRRRLIGRSSWQIALPSPRSTLLQIGIGILDLGAGAIAVYALLPDYPAVEFSVARGVRHRDPARIREPRAWKSRRDRGNDAGRTSAVSQGGTAGIAADVPLSLFHCPAFIRGGPARPAGTAFHCRIGGHARRARGAAASKTRAIRLQREPLGRTRRARKQPSGS